MLPKRKLIKKPRHQHKSQTMQQTQHQQNSLTLIQRIKSPIPQVKQQAITVIANLRCLVPQLASQQFLRELINILYQGDNSLCHQTLYAMVNLCELQPKIVNVLFGLGLDKALVNLQARTQALLKPILVFFISVNEHVKANYRYLVEGIRGSLKASHLVANPELCLQFLYKTRNSNSGSKSIKLSQQIITQILSLYNKAAQSPTIKSYALAILGYELMPEKAIQQMIISHLTQQLVLINLQQQYEMNFPQQQKKQKKHHNKNKQPRQQQLQQQQNEEDEQQEQMQEQGKLSNNKHKQQADKTAIQAAQRQKLKYFLQAVSGIQVLMEFVLDVMEEEVTGEKCSQEWDEEQQQQDDQQQQQQMQGQQQQKTSLSSITSLKHTITTFLHQNMPIFPKFLSTTAPGTQNLVYLFYHLLLQTAKTLPQTAQTKEEINKLIEVSLISLFNTVDVKRQTLSYEEYELLVQCLQIGLGVIMKHKSLGVSDNFLLQFTKKYLLQPSIFSSAKLLQMVKPSWLIMLEIFSLRYNPQKNHLVTIQSNYFLGEMLKYLIVSLPYSQLQQFRCQVIDTVFDVYSNQRFDDGFVKLGYFQVLEHIVKQGHSQSSSNKLNSNKNNKKSNKQQKFVVDVIKDTKRFLEYKNKMIKR